MLDAEGKPTSKRKLRWLLWLVVIAILALSVVGFQTFNDFFSPDANGLAKFRDAIDD